MRRAAQGESPLGPAVALLEQGFEVRDREKVALASGGPLHFDQFPQSEAETLIPEQGNGLGVRAQVFEGAASGDLPPEIEGALIGEEREVYGVGIPAKRLVRWSAARIRPVRGERSHEPLDVVGPPRTDNVEIPRRERGTVQRSGETTDDDELNLSVNEGLEEAGEIGQWRPRRTRPAR